MPLTPPPGPQLPKYISHAFGSLDKPWKPGYLRSAYGAISCHLFKPKNMTDDIFLAQILGHKLLGPNAALSVGQSYKDFYVVQAVILRLSGTCWVHKTVNNLDKMPKNLRGLTGCKKASLLVVGDGGGPRDTIVFTVLDNLIHQQQLPPMVAVTIEAGCPGRAGKRARIRVRHGFRHVC